MTKSRNAVASMRGYRYQELVALDLLLESISNHSGKIYDCSVRIEGDEDICNQLPGETQYIQVKNSESGSDNEKSLHTSDEFWGTIEQWIDLYIRDGKTNSEAKFIFHAVYKFKVNTGSALRPLNRMLAMELGQEIEGRLGTSIGKDGKKRGYYDLIHSVKDKWIQLSDGEKKDFCSRLCFRDCQLEATQLFDKIRSNLRFKTVNSTTAEPEIVNTVFGWWEQLQSEAKRKGIDEFSIAEASELAEILDQAAQMRSADGLTFSEYERLEESNQVAVPQELDVSAYVEKIGDHLPVEERKRRIYRSRITPQLSCAYMYDLEATKNRATFKDDLEEYQKRVASEIEDQKALAQIEVDDDSDVPPILLRHFTFMANYPVPTYGAAEAILEKYIRGSAHKLVDLGREKWEV